MKTAAKPLIAAATVLVALVLASLIYFLIDRAQAPDPASASILRPDSRVLDDGGTDAVTIVEFLDFECEACRRDPIYDRRPGVQDVGVVLRGEGGFPASEAVGVSLGSRDGIGA